MGGDRILNRHALLDPGDVGASAITNELPMAVGDRDGAGSGGASASNGTQRGLKHRSRPALSLRWPWDVQLPDRPVLPPTWSAYLRGIREWVARVERRPFDWARELPELESRW